MPWFVKLKMCWTASSIFDSEAAGKNFLHLAFKLEIFQRGIT